MKSGLHGVVEGEVVVREGVGGVGAAAPVDEEAVLGEVADAALEGDHVAALDETDLISRLKDSLSKALVPFYPLAGRLSWAPEGGGRVNLHCRAQGVPIFEAESDDFGDFSPSPAMQAFIPSVDYTTPIEEIPMIIVQLTRFSCGGVTIGLGVSHVMADGPSALHFVDEWAKIARGAGPAVLPYLDRKVMESHAPPSSPFDAAALCSTVIFRSPENRRES